MVCPNCGAQIKDTDNFCQYCGKEISPDAGSVPAGKPVCPRCGSSNIVFNREKQGEYVQNNNATVIRSTVGMCKDCGYTWNAEATEPKKRKTWLWVLGWIFLFPVPLTILMLRRKNINPVVKYGVIAAAWVLYLLIAVGGAGSKTAETTPDVSVPEQPTVTERQTVTEQQTTEAAAAETSPATETSTATVAETEETTAVKVNIDTVISLIESQVPQDFDYREVEGDETGITINVGTNGVALEATLAKTQGKGEDYEPWAEMRDAMVGMCNAASKLMETFGYPDILVMVNVVNDQNTDNVLLSILNGIVVYDVLAE